MKQIYLVGHGETEANRDDVFRGCHPDLWKKWVTEPENLKFEEGESLADVYRRGI